MTLPDWNAVRFDPLQPRGHVESYFMKLNDPEGRRALWLKATIFAPADQPQKAEGEAWAVAFDRQGEHVAVKETVPISRARFSRTGLDLNVGGLRMGVGKVEGKVTSGGRQVEVDLEFTHDAEPWVHFPAEAMYRLALPKSKAVSPHPDSVFNGFYKVDGRKVEVDGWRGMQGHNWGSEHAALYAWSHCNQWDQDEDVMFEGLTARIKLGPLLAPPLTLICVRYQGKTHAFNGPLQMVRATGNIGVPDLRWRFSIKGSQGNVEGMLSGAPEDFVGLYYRNPNGKMTHCLNTKIGRAEVTFRPRGGKALELTSSAAALEIATQDPAHPVRMHV